MKDDGRYARKPAQEIRAIVEAYKRDEELPGEEPEKDEWEVDTAVESPQALMGTRGIPKRSGEYLIHLEKEFANRLEDERRLAASTFGRRK